MSTLLKFILIISVIKLYLVSVKITAAATNTAEEFYEELYVQPLASGFVNTYFQFTTQWYYGSQTNLYNTRLIPRSIAEILLLYDIKELHVSLTQGLWRYELWGYPVTSAPPGAEVWAWFAGDNLTDSQVNEQWMSVASTLSGITCASLNFIDGTNTISPKYGFRPQFVYTQHPYVNKFVRYSSLPREVVCTENLTPWKKLLPCSSYSGFVSLLNSGHVYNTNYNSLSMQIRTICSSSNDCKLQFTETANLVFDPKLLIGNKDNDFSFRRLFGQGLNGYCPLAKSSKIYVNLQSPFNYELTVKPMQNLTSIRGGTVAVYGVFDIQKMDNTRFFNIAWYQNKTSNLILKPIHPILYGHRYIIGNGQERGKILVQLTNSYHKGLPIILQQNIPWFMPIYLHSLKLINQKTASFLNATSIHYIPGIQRNSPYHLELSFTLPSKTTVDISIDFDYVFLKWLEYPPDANHGHYVGSAVITTQLPVTRNYTSIPINGYRFSDSFNASQNLYHLVLYTETLILNLPTPDFSMPYNVICLACTVVALAFGPIHSATTKRIIIEQKRSTSNKFLKNLFSKFRRRKTKTTTNSYNESSEKSEHCSQSINH